MKQDGPEKLQIHPHDPRWELQTIFPNDVLFDPKVPFLPFNTNLFQQLEKQWSYYTIVQEEKPPSLIKQLPKFHTTRIGTTILRALAILVWKLKEQPRPIQRLILMLIFMWWECAFKYQNVHDDTKQWWTKCSPRFSQSIPCEENLSQTVVDEINQHITSIIQFPKSSVDDVTQSLYCKAWPQKFHVYHFRGLLQSVPGRLPAQLTAMIQVPSYRYLHLGNLAEHIRGIPFAYMFWNAQPASIVTYQRSLDIKQFYRYMIEYLCVFYTSLRFNVQVFRLFAKKLPKFRHMLDQLARLRTELSGPWDTDVKDLKKCATFAREVSKYYLDMCVPVNFFQFMTNTTRKHNEDKTNLQIPQDLEALRHAFDYSYLLKSLPIDEGLEKWIRHYRINRIVQPSFVYTMRILPFLLRGPDHTAPVPSRYLELLFRCVALYHSNQGGKAKIDKILARFYKERPVIAKRFRQVCLAHHDWLRNFVLPLPDSFAYEQTVSTMQRIQQNHIPTDRVTWFLYCPCCMYPKSSICMYNKINAGQIVIRRSDSVAGYQDVSLDTRTGYFYCRREAGPLKHICPQTVCRYVDILGKYFYFEGHVFTICCGEDCGNVMEIDPRKAWFRIDGYLCSYCTFENEDIRREWKLHEPTQEQLQLIEDEFISKPRLGDQYVDDLELTPMRLHKMYHEFCYMDPEKVHDQETRSLITKLLR